MDMMLRTMLQCHVPETSMHQSDTKRSIKSLCCNFRFQECRESGQVTEMILEILERSFFLSEVKDILGENLLGAGRVTFDSIPDAWKDEETSQAKGRRRNHRNNRW